MRAGLALLGAIAALGGAAAHHHQRRYWWTATSNCTLETGYNRQGQLVGRPYVVCTTAAPGWHRTPQPWVY